MWKVEFTKTYKNVDKQKVWEILTDVNSWPTWHHDLEYCKLEGEFKVGNHFHLKPKGAPKVQIILTEIDEGNSFTDCTLLWGAKMYDTHKIEETKDGLKFTNTISVAGPLKWLWVKLVAQNVANTIEQEIEELVKLAQSK